MTGVIKEHVLYGHICKFVLEYSLKKKKNYKFLYIMYCFSSKMNTSKRGKGEENEEDYIDVSKEAKTYLGKFLGDVSKTSATKQMIIGSTTGWYYMFHILLQLFLCII